MMKLVIAEKPSVGKSIAAVLGATAQRSGYMEGNGYIVTWCFGHLVGLANPEVYDAKYGKWRREDLPILPDHWQRTVSRERIDQFDLIKELMNRDDVSGVVNACDAGREGELIFRDVYEEAKCSKPMERLWISSMEDSAIQEGFANLKPGSAYDNLYAAAQCRDQADWLVGINATRLYSVMYHRTLNVGRVMSPTLAMITDRDKAIAEFRPETFYTVLIAAGSIEAESERIAAKDDATNLAARCRHEKAVVQRVEQQDKSEKAPALYDLTTLQRDANRLLGFTAQQTLDYTQALYEKKLCTYPRTDSRYLTDDMARTAAEILPVAAKIAGLTCPTSPDISKICNSREVSDHHAIIPTRAADTADMQSLPTGELAVLMLIANRMLCAVSDPYRYTDTTVTLLCGGHTFVAKGKTILQKGWRTLSKETVKEKYLPDVVEGDAYPVSKSGVHEGKTTPPHAYTEDSLLSAMETAGAKDTPEEAERKGLGTPATRAEIIEKLVSVGFLERKKAQKNTSLVATSLGNAMASVLPEDLRSPLLTAEWERGLLDVEHGDKSPGEFNAAIAAMVQKLVASASPVPNAAQLFPSNRPVVGKCPRCGNDVTETRKGFFCEGKTCRFGLWRDNKYLAYRKIELTTKMATTLLKEGRVAVKGIQNTLTGKTYDATLVLHDDGSKLSYSMDYGSTTKKNGKK